MKIKLAIIIISLSIFFSCTDENDNEFSKLPSIYPLSIGNNWEYDRTINLQFKDDSTEVGVSAVYTDTTTYSYKVFQEVIKDTVLADTIPVFMIKRKEIDDNNKQDDGYSIRYFTNKEDGLYSIIEYISGKKYEGLKKYSLKGIRFNTIEELKEILLNKPGTSIKSDYGLMKQIHYPIDTGIEWTKYSYWPHIYCEINETRDITTEAGKFQTYKIETFWDLDEDGVFDNDIIYTEYFSYFGIVKSSEEIWNMGHTNETGELLGYIDWFEEQTLTNCVIFDEE